MPLPNIKDPVITELQRICTTQLAVPATFMEANLREANFDIDKIQDNEWPVVLYVADKGGKSKFNEANDVIRKAEPVVWIIDKYDRPTLEAKSPDVNMMLNRARMLGENLMYWINKSSISAGSGDGANGVDDWTYEPILNGFDIGVYGQELSFEWQINTASGGYYNNAY